MLRSEGVPVRQQYRGGGDGPLVDPQFCRRLHPVHHEDDPPLMLGTTGTPGGERLAGRPGHVLEVVHGECREVDETEARRGGGVRDGPDREPSQLLLVRVEDERRCADPLRKQACGVGTVICMA